jgi:hypothetical protein
MQINDPWRWNLAASCNFCLGDLSPAGLNRDLYPIEHDIATSFEKFRQQLLATKENFLYARMIDNSKLLRSAPGRRPQERGCIDRNLLGGRFYDENKKTLQRINMNVLIQNGALVSYNSLRAASG